ncbi:MAG: hypothetical protein AAF585_19345 [Verrucomicrobiota bacterium]
MTIAVREVQAYLDENEKPERAIFCCFGDEIANEYRKQPGL